MFYIFPQNRRERHRFPLTINMICYNHLQEPVFRTQSSDIDFYQWIYCIDGQGEVIIKGRKTILSPGKLVLIFPNEEHSYHAITEEWHVHIIGFSGNCCAEVLQTFKMYESGIYHSNDEELFGRYLSQMLDVYNARDEAGHIDMKKVSTLCYDFLLELSFAVEYVSSTIAVTENVAIREIINYMEEHYREPITLDDLARQVNLSRSYVSEIFKKEIQTTVIQYLTMIRLSRARVMLIEHPEMKIREVASKCGFENPSYFGEVFKKETGMTPVEYRIM